LYAAGSLWKKYKRYHGQGMTDDTLKEESYGKVDKRNENRKKSPCFFRGGITGKEPLYLFCGCGKKAGYEQIAAIFLETADNEKEHAKRFFKLLEGGEVEISASYPAGIIGDTPGNLAAAAAGENLEWTKLYREAEETARREGFEAIAVQFKEIAEVEEEHEKRYRKLLKNLKDSAVFKKKEAVKWHCRNCGYVHEGKEAPEKCPACAHPQGYYELLCENY